MARRKDHTKEELSHLAITAGVHLVKTNGPAGLSARKIASEIGYSVGTLYNVFTSYEILRLHINGVALDEWHAAIDDMLAKPLQDPLLELARFYMAYSAEHANQWRLLFDDSTPMTLPVPEWYREKITRLFSLLEHLISPLVDNDPIKTRQAAQLLWTGIHGIVALSLSGKLALVGADDAQTLAECFIKTFRAGIKHG